MIPCVDHPLKALGAAQVREYVGQLEVHLAEAHKQAARLIRRQDALSGALADFGTSMVRASHSPPRGIAFPLPPPHPPQAGAPSPRSQLVVSA